MSFTALCSVTAVIPVAETTKFTIHQHVWLLGACKKCGLACEHAFVDGVCSICELSCTHAVHDEKTRICQTCNMVCEHDYSYYQRTCSRCQRELVLYDDFLPDEYFQPCEKAGNVDYVELNTFRGKQTISIYTPYGYDSSQKYDVMVIIGGINSSCRAWFDVQAPISREYCKGRILFDNMIDKGACRPMIFMSINTCAKEIMSRYMKESFLPYLLENYSTYATSIDDMPTQRDHFAIGGISWGGYQTYYGGLGDMFDLFAYYCPIAGSTDPERAAKSIENNFKAYDVKLFVSGCGTCDGVYRITKAHYDYLVANIPSLKEGENTFWLECSAVHGWKEAAIITFDFLQLAFP